MFHGEKRIPVHNEPGAVQFKYDLITPSFTVACLPSSSKEALNISQVYQQPLKCAKKCDLPEDRPDGDAEQDFLAFGPVGKRSRVRPPSPHAYLCQLFDLHSFARVHIQKVYLFDTTFPCCRRTQSSRELPSNPRTTGTSL